MSTPAIRMPTWSRAAVLFVNFFLIILAYYQVKPASRSLFVEYGSASLLPWAWIGSALTLILAMPLYQHMLSRFGRLRVVLGSCLTFVGLLLVFRLLMGHADFPVAFGFYIVVDILSVVLVEQFWSLSDSIFHEEEGKRWYGFVGSGGVAGGLAGGLTAAWLVGHTPLDTPDLLTAAALIILLVFVISVFLASRGFYVEVVPVERREVRQDTWGLLRLLGRSRYLTLITASLLLAQLAEPIVEYQFMSYVEVEYTEREARTVFLANFATMLGIVALVINLTLTPLVHRLFGVIAGLVVQPFVLGVASVVFMARSGLLTGGIMKIADRGLSYSINRASKELLYAPLDPRTIYPAKAWIDMVGYRAFKIIGSFLILALTQWIAAPLSVPDLSYVALAICGVWIGVVWMIRDEFHELEARETVLYEPA